LISHEYESIANETRRPRQRLTNDLVVASNDQVFVCDIDASARKLCASLSKMLASTV
jgi:hypothetical protein